MSTEHPKQYMVIHDQRTYTQGIEEGERRATERIVAYLRNEAELLTGTNTTTAFRVSEALTDAARFIERGEHEKERMEKEIQETL